MSNFIILKEEKINDNYGKEPSLRSIDELLDKGIIIVDKDSGPTSHMEVDLLKKVLNIDKAGHSGTLDPKVTGVLVTGIGKGTKIMEYMLKSNKEYVCLMHIHKPVDKKTILNVFDKFTGVIKQTPPVVSAVKRVEREREVYSIKLLDYDEESQKYVLFRVSCESGTYIRKLCSDIGEDLKVGAQMKELRRTKAGPFHENNSPIISLDSLRNLYELYLEEKNEEDKLKYEMELRKYILPAEEALPFLKKVYVRDSAVNSISHGSDLAIPGVYSLQDDIEIGDEVALYTRKGEIIGIGIAYLNSKKVQTKSKGAFVKISKVLVEPNFYPAEWKF